MTFLLEKNPYLAQLYEQDYCLWLENTGLSIDTFPQECCFSLEEVLDEDYLPLNSQ